MSSEWMPIETAPKDGTHIIVGRPGKPVWAGVRWRVMLRGRSRWDSFVGPVPFEPTHWMPLPDAPEVPHA